MSKYNFALVPIGQGEQFVEYATQLSYLIGSIGQYCLKPNIIPHVTLCQFDSDEDELDMLWKKFNKLEHPNTIKLIFNKVKNTINAGKNWFSLIPNEVLALKFMHKNSLKIIKEPKNLYGDNYDPNLTLLNSLDLQKSDDAYKINVPLTAIFCIAITNRDEAGQAFKIIRCNDVHPILEKKIKLSIVDYKDHILKN
ncbi:MAG: hypothetical protein JO131_02210 [Gammaproteobacteria bacterium]|nr:hypothetical protein [Gammaproteobacteria bacterium]